MVWFQCDDKRKKNVFFWFLSGKFQFFFRKNFGARYLIVKYQRLITRGLCNEGLLFSFLIYGKSMVGVFWVQTWNFHEQIFK